MPQFMGPGPNTAFQHEEAWNSRAAPDLFPLPGSDLITGRFGNSTVGSFGLRFSLLPEEERVAHPYDGVRGPGIFGRFGISFE